MFLLLLLVLLLLSYAVFHKKNCLPFGTAPVIIIIIIIIIIYHFYYHFYYNQLTLKFDFGPGGPGRLGEPTRIGAKTHPYLPLRRRFRLKRNETETRPFSYPSLRV